VIDMARLAAFKPVTDDWHPNYPGNQVAVVFNEVPQPKHPTPYVVAVTGGDDDLRNKGYATYEEALGVFLSLLREPYLNHRIVERIGLER
jgi:hypothetical protein